MPKCGSAFWFHLMYSCFAYILFSVMVCSVYPLGSFPLVSSPLQLAVNDMLCNPGVLSDLQDQESDIYHWTVPFLPWCQGWLKWEHLQLQHQRNNCHHWTSLWDVNGYLYVLCSDHKLSWSYLEILLRKWLQEAKVAKDLDSNVNDCSNATSTSMQNI